jgi:BolA protein
MDVIETLKSKLVLELEAEHVEVIDDSWQHAGHAEARSDLGATHLTIVIVSKRFVGVSLMDQHRMVHAVLQEAREKHLHALQLKTLTPDAWKA